MNVYDFDKTIFAGDSTVSFYFFELRRHPLLIKHLPKQFSAFFSYFRKKIDKTQMKERFYVFLSSIDTEKEVESFWQKKKKKIYPFYLERKKSSDVIISASPEFLLKVIADELHFNLIASRVSPADGKYDGLNCYGDEKVSRFREAYGDAVIDEFYSDSLSDLPLAKIAKRAFLVKKGKIIDNGYGLN